MSLSRRKPKKVKRKAAVKAKPARRVSSAGERRRIFGRIIVPAFLSVSIMVCLGALFFLSYRSVTASDFFKVGHIAVFGAERTSGEEIQRIIAMQTEMTGTWNAELDEIRARIEKVPFVKSASVSRVLPNEIRVNITEHTPVGIARLSGGDFLIDGNGNILSPVSGPEPSLKIALIGWDESKSPAADRDNAARIKVYSKFLDETRELGLDSRVSALDISDVREPRAVTEDSGAAVTIAIGRENFGENLKRGIKAIVGKGEVFEAVNLVGQNMILAPRKSAAKTGVGK